VQKLLFELCFCLLCLYADDLLKLLNDFYRRTEVRRLAAENGLDGKCDLTSGTFVAVDVVIFVSLSHSLFSLCHSIVTFPLLHISIDA